MKLKKVVIWLVVLAAIFSCSTPKNIVYMQDAYDDELIEAIKSNPIRLKPMDQISIIVNCREPQIAAMFNLPYIARRIGETQSLSSSSGNVGNLNTSNARTGYTVDPFGYIDFPVIGKIYVQGLTRSEATEHIKNLLIQSNQVKDPVVTIDFMNLGFSVLGEVSRPGRYRIDRDEFTILDAISLAGDLTINGERQNVRLIRKLGEEGERFFTLDITNAAETFSSPAYYMEQGDIIYVTPNPKRRRESTVNANSAFTASFWISLVSAVTSVTSTIIVLATR